MLLWRSAYSEDDGRCLNATMAEVLDLWLEEKEIKTIFTIKVKNLKHGAVLVLF